MNKSIIMFSAIILASFLQVFADLERVNDEDLDKLIRNEKFVIALFRSSECKDCDLAESTLSSIREDLVDALNAWVVTADSSSLAVNFTIGPLDVPRIVFFRHGTPMLFDGPLNEEVMLETFTQNQEAAVHGLNDDSFEHLTQAASGATTGDWFVMFYRDDNDLCTRFLPKWEYIASQLKGRINLAKVNVMVDGISTGSRFHVAEIPTFLFFRQGKYYHYDIPNMDSKAFQDFALGWYKNAQSKAVPSPQTPFDELVDRTVFILRENPLILPAAGILVLLVLVAIGLNVWKSRAEGKSSTKKKEKKKTK